MLSSRSLADKANWRFSLKSLLLLIVLAAVCFWLIRWELWDLDERIILGSWFIAVTAAIAYSRRRGGRGIYLSAVCGGLLPTVLVLVYYLIAMTIGESTNITRVDIPYCVIAVFFAGASLGALLAAAFTPQGLAELPPSQQEDRLQRRLLIFSSVSVLFVLAVGGWSIYVRATEWKFRDGFWLPSELHYGKTISLSLDGSHLLATADAKGKADQMLLVIGWNLSPLDPEPVLTTHIPAGSGKAWTPDGNWLAIASMADDVPKISLLPLEPQHKAVEFSVPAPPEAWDEGTVSFSEDGSILRFVMSKDDSPAEKTVYRWSVGDWNRLPEMLDKNLEPSISGKTGRRIEVLTFPGAGPFDDPAYQVEVWAPNVDQPLFSFGPFSDPYPATLSPDGNHLAAGATLIDLRTKTTRELPGVVRAFLRDGKQLLCSRRYDRVAGYKYWGGWRTCPLPLVRHLWWDSDFEQLLLVDSTTGRVIRRSQWISGWLPAVVVSQDGRVAITDDFRKILVWEIPEE